MLHFILSALFRDILYKTYEGMLFIAQRLHEESTTAPLASPMRNFIFVMGLNHLLSTLIIEKENPNGFSISM